MNQRQKINGICEFDAKIKRKEKEKRKYKLITKKKKKGRGKCVGNERRKERRVSEKKNAKKKN